eukprot:CAMPEP_0184719522 /NCGR_PEP_ID=MMETSP0314-20130426/8721_1 /TAXON_ID=38298 /ORGANISM="Rhodella maculata, Strain CCMP 736" /LENGTH=55 /DNA_ID=CAMNT_0027183417 /DNA_START=24 /DNA_END=187 /DNA_ORIENTATION=+
MIATLAPEIPISRALPFSLPLYCQAHLRTFASPSKPVLAAPTAAAAPEVGKGRVS